MVTQGGTREGSARRQNENDFKGGSNNRKNSYGDRNNKGGARYSVKPDKPHYDKKKTYSSFSGKDDDDEDNSRRSRSYKPKESKPAVAIPDKDKTMLRIEKEQKTIKKKQQSKKKESNRPQQKVKRANNINYTRSYANGDYDDYEDYYDV